MMSVVERIFCSRKVWIAIGTLLIVVASVLGLDADKATKLSASVVSLAIAVITAIGIEDAADKSNRGKTTPAAAPPPSTPAREIGVLLFCLLLLPIVGCAAPAGPYVAADRATLNSVGQEYLTLVRRASPDEAGNFDPITEPLFTREQLKRRENKLTTWRLRVEQAERESTAATQPAR
jgi:hypothetical protein